MSFSLRQLRFAPSLIPSVAALIAVTLTAYLGSWQRGRVIEKQSMQAEFDARSGEPAIVIGPDTRDPAFRFRQAQAEGDWLVSAQIYLDNKHDQDKVGYHVITPLKLSGTNSYLLVNRGWIPRGATYPAPPVADVAAGKVKVSGQLSVPSTRYLELSSQGVEGGVWQNLSLERYRDRMHLEVLPFVLLAQEAMPPLVKVSERPDARAEKHLEYMLTWYSLAVTVIVLWVGLNLKRAQPGVDNAQSSMPRQGAEP